MARRSRILPLLIAALLAGGGAVAGCGEEDVRQGVDDAQQQGEEAAEDAGNAVEGAAQDAEREGGQAAEDAGNAVEGAAEDAQREAEEQTDGN